MSGEEFSTITKPLKIQEDDNMDYKPWELYPHIWKTEASFWAYLRGGLRRAVWEKSPIKLDFKNKDVKKPPEGYTGRAKSGKDCALSGEWLCKSKLQVDHKKGNISLLSWEDVLPFILHLVPKPEEMQLVGVEAHKIKSYAERYGMTFEEAVVEKKVIKAAKDANSWLIERGHKPAKNAELRRNQIREIMKEGLD